MAINSKKNALVSVVDSIFVVGGEMIEKNGEDSYAYSLNDKYGFIGVFDGCGGIGSRKYDSFENKTGAFISSHTSANLMLEWFNLFTKHGYELSSDSMNSVCSSMKENLENELRKYDSVAGTTALKGSLTKNFPTTASMVLFSGDKSKMQALYIWAGDSRGFMLTKGGLIQITRDDIEDDGDALQNLSNDSKLTNMVCADGSFHLNGRMVNAPESGIMITATDGFFGYFSTPMEFEYMLLDTLMASESIAQWKDKLNDYIRKYTADDYTMCVAVYGYKSVRALKKVYAPRMDMLYKKYISGLPGLGDEARIHLWNDYKKDYYRGD
ncbi:MAG: hypothetical protein II998_12855 [Clostridia bacterium]|nr:hypothetical protein [Clostridia bacterium]